MEYKRERRLTDSPFDALRLTLEGMFGKTKLSHQPSVLNLDPSDSYRWKSAGASIRLNETLSSSSDVNPVHVFISRDDYYSVRQKLEKEATKSRSKSDL